MKRRDFLKAGIGGAFALWGLGDAMQEKTAMAAGREALPAGRKIDVHAHAILPSFVQGLKKLGIDAAAEEGYPLPAWSEEAHLEFMRQAQIDYTVLSPATPHIYNGDEKLSCEVAREINEETAALCRKYPDKFGFAAALPFPSSEGSIAEIRYAMDKLGALGVKVPSNAGGIYLGDARWEAVFAELNRRQALIILHPSPARELPRKGTVTGQVMALFAMLAGMQMMKPVDMEAGMKQLYYDLAGDPMPDYDLAGDPMPEAMDMLLKITDEGFSYSWQHEKKWQHGNPGGRIYPRRAGCRA